MGTLQECTPLSRSLMEAWRSMSHFCSMTHSRERKTLSKNVRWKLVKHNKLSYDFSRNTFEKPFKNSSWFFFFLFHIMILSTSNYTTLYWKDSYHHTDSIFLGPSLSSMRKILVASFPVSPPPGEETIALRSMALVSTVKICVLTANYCICDC